MNLKRKRERKTERNHSPSLENVAPSWKSLMNTGVVFTQRSWRVVDSGRRTWPAQLPVLLLLPRVHVRTPGVEGEGEEVLQPGRGANHAREPLQPLLTLLEGGELAPNGRQTPQNKWVPLGPRSHAAAPLSQSDLCSMENTMTRQKSVSRRCM